jgi:phosphohistidine phosphatase
MPAKPTDNTYELCLMRHGIAVMRAGAAGRDDAGRPLTPDGKARIKEIARALRPAGFVPIWIITSPLVRALQTAEIVAKVLGVDAPLDVCDGVAPGGSLEALLAFLTRYPEKKKVLAVGHEPGLSEIAARMIGASRQTNLAFKKGGCCLITFDQFPPKPPGRLSWWLTPRILRRLA